MILQAGDLGVEIDTGQNRPGKLQRLENGEWILFRQDGKLVSWPVELEKVTPGRYRAVGQ